MGSYSSVIGAKQKSSKVLGTKQTQRLSAEQVKNAAGGYVFQADDWVRLDRFLILGTESGTYYHESKTLTFDNAKFGLGLIQKDGKQVVERIVNVSKHGRAISNSPAIFLFAMCAGWGNDEVQNLCCKHVTDVCRTGSHLLEFVSNIKQFRGWGPRLRRIVSAWYDGRTAKELLFQTTKYFHREDWTHEDVVRKAHPKVFDGSSGLVMRYLLKKPMSDAQLKEFLEISELAMDLNSLSSMKKFTPATNSKHQKQCVELVSRGNLQREHLPTEWLQDNGVHEAMARNMPVNALIRNLGQIAARGGLTEDSELTKLFCEKLTNEEALKKARVHPIQVLLASKMYELGTAIRGKSQWIPSHRILLALNDCFNKSFGAIVPTGKTIVVAVDFSGSMAKYVAGLMNLNARDASLAMAMSHVNSEPNCTILAFSSKGHGPFKTGYWTLDIRKGMSLDQVIKYANMQDNGGTDGSLPIMWALENKVSGIDAFITYTDNETWAGKVHVVEAIKAYRYYYNKDCKLIVPGVTATPHTILNTNKDLLSLDVCGFDANLPQVVNSFITL